MRIMFTVVALGPVTCKTNGTGSQLTTVNKKRIINDIAIHKDLDQNTNNKHMNAFLLNAFVRNNKTLFSMRAYG